MNAFGKISFRWRNMVFRLRSGHQTTECRVVGAKLSKSKETAISKIVSEDDVNCFFFDAEGVIYREFVPEGQKVNAEFYVGVLDWLLRRIWQVRTAKFQSSEWFLLHDKAPSHNAVIVKKFLAKRNIAVLHSPPPTLLARSYTCWLLSLPQVKIFLKRAAFSNSGRNSVCSDKGA